MQRPTCIRYDLNYLKELYMTQNNKIPKRCLVSMKNILLLFYIYLKKLDSWTKTNNAGLKLTRKSVSSILCNKILRLLH